MLALSLLVLSKLASSEVAAGRRTVALLAACAALGRARAEDAPVLVAAVAGGATALLARGGQALAVLFSLALLDGCVLGF